MHSGMCWVSGPMLRVKQDDQDNFSNPEIISVAEPIVNFASYYKLAGWASIFGMFLGGKGKDEGVASNINRDSVVNIFLKKLIFIL